MPLIIFTKSRMHDPDKPPFGSPDGPKDGMSHTGRRNLGRLFLRSELRCAILMITRIYQPLLTFGILSTVRHSYVPRSYLVGGSEF